MTDAKRITLLETRVAQLEARLNKLEQAHQTYGPVRAPCPQTPPVWPVPTWPPPPYDITC